MRTEFDIRGSDKKFTLQSVSATSILVRAGPRLGCLTTILDMLKVFLPTLALRLLYPEHSYFLIASAAGIAGHNFPIWYRFKGGRGMSPLYGGLLVIDWLSIPVTLLASNIVGLLLFRDIFLAYTGGPLFLIPWLWYRFDDPAYIVYAITVNLFFWAAILPELKLYRAFRKAGDIDKSEILDAMEGGFGGTVIHHARKRGWIKEKTTSQKPTGEVITEVTQAKPDLPENGK